MPSRQLVFLCMALCVLTQEFQWEEYVGSRSVCVSGWLAGFMLLGRKAAGASGPCELKLHSWQWQGCEVRHGVESAASVL